MRKKLIPFFLLIAFTSQAQRSNNGIREILLRGPYLQAATSTSVVIRWRTDVLTRGIVRFGIAPTQLSSNVQDSVLMTDHKILVRGLAPGTKYYYSIGSFHDTLQAGEGNYFITLPQPGSEAALCRIAAVGDCGKQFRQSAGRPGSAPPLYPGDKSLNALDPLG